jgi:hypothetical protein
VTSTTCSRKSLRCFNEAAAKWPRKGGTAL